MTDSIYYALDHSKFLIVICTPDLPLSKWCEAEIRYFLKTHDRDHILAVLADGTPDVSFSPYMLHDYDEEGNIIKDWEPLAANIDGENHTINNKAFKKESVRLCAAMIGCPFDELWQRERRAKMQRYTVAAVGALAVMAVFLGVVINRNAQITAANEQITAQNEQITAQNDQITKQNDELTEKNSQIEEQNKQIEEQNKDLQRQISSVLVESGRQKLKEYDLDGALSDSLEALKSDDPDIYDHQAEKLLADAMNIYRDNEFQTDVVYEQPADINRIFYGEKTDLVIIVDKDGNVRALDPENFSVRWEYISNDPNSTVYEAKDGVSILCKTRSALCALSPEDGSVRWTKEQLYDSKYLGISDDGSIFAMVDTDSDNYYSFEYFPVYTIFIDTEDGSEIGRVLVSDEEKYSIDLVPTSFMNQVIEGRFSPDNKKFSMFYAAEDLQTEDSSASVKSLSLFCEIDLSTMTKTDISCFRCGFLSFSYGFYYSEDSKELFSAFYSGNNSGILTTLYPEGARSDTVTENRMAHSWKAYMSGLTGSDTTAKANAKILSFGESYLVFSTNELCVAEAGNSTISYMPFESLIVGAYWGDEAHSKLHVITADGIITELLMDGTSLIRNEIVSGGMPEGLKMTASIRGGMIADPENGVFLSVNKEMPGKLLCTKRVSDPNKSVPEYESLLNPEDFILNDFEIQFSPDSDSAMLFTDYSINGGPKGHLNGIGFNRKTGEITGSRSDMNNYFYTKGKIVLDDTHFLFQGMVYDLNGEDEPFSLSRLSSEFTNWSSMEFVRMSDGRILTFYPKSYSYYALCYPVWLDGEMVKGSNNVNTGLNFETLENHQLGENGIIMGYGIDIEQVERRPVPSSEKRFSFFNALTGSLIKMENAHPESEDFLPAMGTVTPVFAAAYSDGSVSVYDLDTLSFRDLQKKYGPNEIKSLCFSEGDDYLCILTTEKRFDIYDAQTLEMLFSEVPTYLDLRNLSDTIKLQAKLSADKSRLVLLAGYSSYCTVFIDTSSWTVQATIPRGVLAIDMENEMVYTVTDSFFMDHNSLRNYPIYSLEDLKELAENALEERNGP